jgi:hypothetical protein
VSLAYLDSGAPPGHGEYTTILFIHGSMWSAGLPIFVIAHRTRLSHYRLTYRYVPSSCSLRTRIRRASRRAAASRLPWVDAVS